MSGRVAIVLILVVAVLACPLACLGGLSDHECHGGAVSSGHEDGCLDDPCMALAAPGDIAQSCGSLELDLDLDLASTPAPAVPDPRALCGGRTLRPALGARALPYHPADVPLRI